MMNDSEVVQLRAEAARATGAAQRIRDLALAVDRRRRVLAGRLDAVRRLHTDAVWSSTAATASRVTLDRVVGRHLWEASAELAAIQAALLRRAGELEAEARWAIRRADGTG